MELILYLAIECICDKSKSNVIVKVATNVVFERRLITNGNSVNVDALKPQCQQATKNRFISLVFQSYRCTLMREKEIPFSQRDQN